jgi:hypothetical protein
LDCPATTIDSDISGEGREEERLPPFKPAIATGTTPRRLSAHDLMEDIEGAGEEGLGMEHGQRVHDFAEAHAEADGREPSSEDESRVMAFLDGLEGTLVPEENAHLPIETDHGRVLIAGIIDLIHLSDDAVEVIDYKTDRSRNGEPEYRKQLSVYYHVLRSVYPDRTVSISIYYTAEGELVHLEPLSRSELRRLVEKAIEE